MVDLDIVIVNWNSGSQLADCIASIALSPPGPGLELSKCVVVDNASSDGSQESAGQLPVPLLLIRNPSNRGFAGASNQGAKIGRAKYILFLNPDVRLFPDSLTQSLLFMEQPQNAGVGILGIQLLDGDSAIQRNVARFPTRASLFFQMLGLNRLWPRVFLGHFMTDWDHNQNRVVDQVQGAFFLVRRELFEALKGFDERFYMYFEDLDFAFRARRAGWVCQYLADARAFHSGGGSSDRVKARRLFYVLCSRTRYVGRHFGYPAALQTALLSIAIECWVRLGWGLLHPSGSAPVETARAYGMFIRELSPLLRDVKKSKYFT